MREKGGASFALLDLVLAILERHHGGTVLAAAREVQERGDSTVIVAEKSPLVVVAVRVQSIGALGDVLKDLAVVRETMREPILG